MTNVPVLVGVVNAVFNFTGFDEIVSKAIDLPKPGCAKRLADHVGALQTYFDHNDSQKVKERFGAQNLIGTPLGDPDFWYMAADAAAMADQVGEQQWAYISGVTSTTLLACVSQGNLVSLFV